MINEVRSALLADATLTALLPGGLHAAVEITRQATPTAFDANNELQVCGLIKRESDQPIEPYKFGGLESVLIFWYQRNDDDQVNAARLRAYTVLNQETEKLGGGIWNIEHVGDVLTQYEPALDCYMQQSRYEILRMKASTI